MGRPPIGERAMTAAEKMRRYRARKFGNRSAVAKTPPDIAERDTTVALIDAVKHLVGNIRLFADEVRANLVERDARIWNAPSNTWRARTS